MNDMRFRTSKLLLLISLFTEDNGTGIHESLLPSVASPPGIYDSVNPDLGTDYYSSVASDNSHRIMSNYYSTAGNYNQSLQRNSKKQPMRTFPPKQSSRIFPKGKKSKDRQTTLGISSYANVLREDQEQIYANVSVDTTQQGNEYKQEDSIEEAATPRQEGYEYAMSPKSLDIALENSFEQSEEPGYDPYLRGSEYAYATIDRPTKLVNCL